MQINSKYITFQGQSINNAIYHLSESSTVYYILFSLQQYYVLQTNTGTIMYTI